MTFVFGAITAGIIAFLLYMIVMLDSWLGILAFEFRYLIFAMVVAGMIAGVWLGRSRKASIAAGTIVLTMLMTPYLFAEPSSRILREVLLDVQPGTHVDQVEELVSDAYKDSGYVMPRMKRDPDRLHVSLLSQHPGDCTAAIFRLKDNRVIQSTFSAD